MNENLNQWVDEILKSPQNIATKVELQEQSRVAFNLFIEADIDGSETLSVTELKQLCDTAGLPMENNEEDVLMKIDKDNSGYLDIEEWIKWWLHRISALPNPVKQQEVICRNTFRKYDVDRSGFLDASEFVRLTEALGATFSQEDIDKALREIDADDSGVIEIDEFVAWWTNRASQNRSNASLISLKMRKLALKAAQIFNSDIFIAAWEGDLELLNAFLMSESRLAQAADSSEYGEGWTALHYAAYQGHQDAVSALLDARADVNRINDMGFSALFYAAQRGHLEICKMMLERGADPCIPGICLLPQPLGVEIPSGSGQESALAPAPEVFMCPAAHILDYPELKDIFQSGSSKCCLPLVPDYQKITASLCLSSSTLSLCITQTQKLISQLPVDRWEVKLRMDMQMDTELIAAEVYGDIVASGLSLAISIPAIHPKKPQSFSTISIDREWSKKLQFLCVLHKLKRLQLLVATPTALSSAFAEFCTVYASLDAQYRRVLNVPDFIYSLIKKCSDRKNTKDLRHGLRAAIEQVTIRSTGNLAGVNNQPEKGRNGKNSMPNSMVDVKDSIALVLAGINELIVKHATIPLSAQSMEQHRHNDSKIDSATGGPPQSIHQDKIPAPPREAKLSATVDSVDEGGQKSSSGNGWVWTNDSSVGFPTVTLQVAAVSCWGIGDFSSTVPVSISYNKVGKQES